MVQICIKIENKENIDEWSIIELQGDLEVKQGEEGLSNKLLGDLYFSKEGIPTLIIGHHILYGKIVDLDKPLLVMKKEKINLSNNLEINMIDKIDIDNDDDDKSSIPNTEYHVQAVIRRKILFNKRPRPIVILDVKKKL